MIFSSVPPPGEILLKKKKYFFLIIYKVASRREVEKAKPFPRGTASSGANCAIVIMRRAASKNGSGDRLRGANVRSWQKCTHLGG